MRKSAKTLLFSSIIALCALTGCAKKEAAPTLDLNHHAPDYTRVNGEFKTFGYTPPTNGHYYENTIDYYSGQDFRTVERYREYKEAGLNVLMLQNEDRCDYQNPWEQSVLKKRMDDIQEAGLEHCIVNDTRLYDLCNTLEPLIGPDGIPLHNINNILNGLTQFPSEEALDAYVKTLIKDYRTHPIFYGVMLRDEPFYQHLHNFGLTYQSLKRVAPNIYLEANLLPMSVGLDQYNRYVPAEMKWKGEEEPTMKDTEEAYRFYLKEYLKYSKADKILMDSYPFQLTSNGRIHQTKETHLRSLQIIGDLCAERGLKFEAVAQTYGGKAGKTPNRAKMNAATMQWQLNAYMGFGVQTFGYFTYWRKVMNSSLPGGEWFNDGESFISNDGTKTNIYYSMQLIHQEMQKMAKPLSCFRYKNATTFINGSSEIPVSYAEMEERDMTLFKRSDFHNNEGGVALVTELRDHKSIGKNQYMYMVQNALDPFYKEIEENKNDDKTMMDFSIQFDADRYNAAEVYFRGERRLVPLDNGKYSSRLDAGYAEYIMPYKA